MLHLLRRKSGNLVFEYKRTESETPWVYVPDDKALNTAEFNLGFNLHFRNTEAANLKFLSVTILNLLMLLSLKHYFYYFSFRLQGQGIQDSQAVKVVTN